MRLGVGASTNEYLCDAAGEEHDHQVGTHRCSRDATECCVYKPTETTGSRCAGTFPARRNQSPRGVQGNRGDGGTGPECSTEYPMRWVLSQEDDRQAKYERKARDDEAESSEN